MKKFAMIFMFVIFMTGKVWGNALPVSSGSVALTSDYLITNTTLASANTIYTVTFTRPVVWINLQAIGGNVYWKTSGTDTSRPYWTILQNATFWDSFPLPLAVDSSIYVWSDTAGATLESICGVR